MRDKVFRTLAGLLAIAFAWMFLIGKFADRSLRDQYGIVVIAVMFAIYACAGKRLGEWWSGPG